MPETIIRTDLQRAHIGRELFDYGCYVGNCVDPIGGQDEMSLGRFLMGYSDTFYDTVTFPMDFWSPSAKHWQQLHRLDDGTFTLETLAAVGDADG